MSPNVASGGCPAGAVPGALRFGLPSAPFGTPGFKCSAHCADSDAEKAATMAADTTTVNDRFMSPSNESPSISLGASRIPDPASRIPARVHLRLRLGIRAREQLLPGACQGDRLRVCVVRPVLGSRAFDRDDIAGLQRQSRPAGPHEATGRGQLEPPVADGAFLVLRVDVDPR